MNSKDFTTKVTAAFLAVFPNGWVHIKPLPLGGDVGICFGLTRDLEDVSAHIRENDTMRMTFAIHGMKFGSDNNITEKLEMEPYYSAISTIPRKQYYAMGHDKIKTRKTTNTPEKLLETLTRYFKAAGVQVQTLAKANELYNQDRIKPAYLEINVK